MARLLELTLNGRRRVDAVPDNRLLLDYLRETAGLTGTKTGCDGGECGACTVLIDDKPTLSCLTLAATAVRQARRHGGVAGQGRGAVGRAARLPREARLPVRLLHAGLHHGLRRPAAPQSQARREPEIREALGSNICRCTGYVKIIEAVQHASAAARRRRGGEPMTYCRTGCREAKRRAESQHGCTELESRCALRASRD